MMVLATQRSQLFGVMLIYLLSLATAHVAAVTFDPVCGGM